jgi:hypothetical protein
MTVRRLGNGSRLVLRALPNGRFGDQSSIYLTVAMGGAKQPLFVGPFVPIIAKRSALQPKLIDQVKGSFPSVAPGICQSVSHPFIAICRQKLKGSSGVSSTAVQTTEMKARSGDQVPDGAESGPPAFGIRKGESGHPPIRRRAAIPTSFAAPDQLVIASNGSTLDADLE